MGKIWTIMEQIIHFFIYKVLHINLKEDSWKKLCQFVKFGMVGLSNTLISYIVYVFLVALSVHYLVASVMGFLISVVNAYYWNDKYVFQEEEQKRVWWKAFLKTFMAYAGTGLILNNILLILWVNVLEIHEMIGPVLNLFITIPLNFLLNKYWAFRTKH